QSSATSVPDAMLHAGRSQYDHVRTKFAFLGTDLECAEALQHDVNLIRPLVGMDFLPLAGLKAIHVTEHSLGLEQIGLGHFLAAESHAFAHALEHHYLSVYPFSAVFLGRSSVGSSIGHLQNRVGRVEVVLPIFRSLQPLAGS